MTIRAILPVVTMTFSLALAPATAVAGPVQGSSQWQEDLEQADAKLRDGKWKPGKRAARKLAEEVLFHGWHDRGLGQILAELACYQAVASANLGQKDEAIWFWHMAQNIDLKIRDKDLAPYGEAGKLLREFPLRLRGEAPPSFQVVEPIAGRFVHAAKDPSWSPELPYNAGAQAERPGDLHVELIVDRHGQAHHPVVLATQHPIMVYGLLDVLRTMPRLKPARDSGEPVDSLFKYVITPSYTRWDQGGSSLRGTIENR